MARTHTMKSLMNFYTDEDRERICLAPAEHPTCGPYLCQLPKGHETGDDPKLKKHHAACRKHHCCVVSWSAA